MWKPGKVVMLPTNQKATIVLNPTTNKIQYNDTFRDAKYYTNAGFKVFDIYIVSDEKPVKGDWVYDTRDRIVTNNILAFTLFSKKIIATTDTNIGNEHCPGRFIPELPNEQVCKTFCPQCLSPRISQSFVDKYISEYNKGNVITDVMVEYEEAGTNEDQLGIPIDYDKVKEITKLHINSDNTINIQQSKDSWTRQEVVALCTFAWDTGYDNRDKIEREGIHAKLVEFDKWIEQNL